MLGAVGLGKVDITTQTAMPVEEQFWQQFDVINDLTESSMRKELPNFISDPSNQAKVQAMLGSSDAASALPAEETRQIA